MKKNAFTLIELLAVIVILAVILVIAIPRILDVIETSKKDSFKNAAQLIADSAEKKKVSDKLLGKDEEITCKDVAKISDEDYASCTISFDENGIAKVSILGKGKFDGLAIIDGTKMSSDVIELELPEYGVGKTYIENLYNNEILRKVNNLKKDNTVDENIRYYGSDPNNYVRFNNELWRIIGVFGDNVKLIRNETLGKLSWDSSESSINVGYGVNQWGESTYEDGTTYEGSDLMQYLNKMYYGGDTTIKCHKFANNREVACPTNKLNAESKVLVDNYTWNTGAIEYNTRTDTPAFYKDERGNQTGKICSSGTECNDTVVRKTTWTGYIGLPYATDYAYASSENICETNMVKQDSSNAYICKNKNWMHYGSKWLDVMWMLSPSASSSKANIAWGVNGDGIVCYNSDMLSLYVFPSIYLKSNVIIESGNGTSGDPYILKAGA